MGPSGLEMEGDKMLSVRGFLQWRHQDLRKAIMITMTPFYKCSHCRGLTQCWPSRELRVASLREAGISIRSSKQEPRVTDKSELEHTLSQFLQAACPSCSRVSQPVQPLQERKGLGTNVGMWLSPILNKPGGTLKAKNN